MEKYAQIPVISNGVVFSDPGYDDTVWCQYRKEFTDTDWLMKLETKADDGFIDFTMTLGRPTAAASCKVEPSQEGFQLEFPSRYTYQVNELGMDTAAMFCGLKEHWDAFAEEASLRTGTDGFFGDLIIFTCKGENAPAGFVLVGGVIDCFVSEQELFQHFLSSFSAREITPEQFADRTNPKALAFRVLASAEFRHAQAAAAPTPGIPSKENEH